jgi:hypothetical protein
MKPEPRPPIYTGFRTPPRAWLSASASVSQAARRFAKWSAIGSLVLGMAVQVAYHLLTQAGTARAPWAITTAVSCLPVLVLGMGAALAHLLSADACDSRGSAPTPVRAPCQPDDESMDRRSQRMVLAESGSQTQRGSAVGHGPDQVTTMKRSRHQGGTDCHSPKTSTKPRTGCGAGNGRATRRGLLSPDCR